MNVSPFLFAALLSLAVPVVAAPKDGLKSPDGNLGLSFYLKDVGGEKACPVYRVTYKGRPVLADSRLGLHLKEGPLDSGFEIVNFTMHGAGSTWRPVCGESEVVNGDYNEGEFNLRQTSEPHRLLRITFRAYNAGIAFCYTIPDQPGLKNFTITSEDSAFSFTADHKAWAVYRAQGNYDPTDPRQSKNQPLGGEVPLSTLKPGVERPLTVKVADDLYAAIAEAKLVNYARMKLRPAKSPAFTVEAFLDAEGGVNGEVTGTTMGASRVGYAWRDGATPSTSISLVSGSPL